MCLCQGVYYYAFQIKLAAQRGQKAQYSYSYESRTATSLYKDAGNKRQVCTVTYVTPNIVQNGQQRGDCPLNMK